MRCLLAIEGSSVYVLDTRQENYCSSMTLRPEHPSVMAYWIGDPQLTVGEVDKASYLRKALNFYTQISVVNRDRYVLSRSIDSIALIDSEASKKNQEYTLAHWNGMARDGATGMLVIADWQIEQAERLHTVMNIGW